MNNIKVFIVLFLLAFFPISSYGQTPTSNKAKVKTLSNPEYVTRLDKIKGIVSQVEETKQKSNDTLLEVIKRYDMNMENREKNIFSFITWVISIFGAMGIGTFFYNAFVNTAAKRDARRKINEAKEELISESKILLDKLRNDNSIEINKIITSNRKIIMQLISSNERDYLLRENAKICVIKNTNTPPSNSFNIVLGLFEKFNHDADIQLLDNLAEALNSENISRYKELDLIIIENQAEEGRWDVTRRIGPSEKQSFCELVESVNEDLKDDLKNDRQNQAIMVKLANNICENTAMVYYGPGVFPIENVKDSNQHLLAYAQSPSTLFSNIMNILKFKDIIDSQTEN
jgi:hypothetical protein